MKCISLWQPWATLISISSKRYETRSWPTNYVGPLAIHAAKKWSGEQDQLLSIEPFCTEIWRAGFQLSELPRGAIVATCRLVTCVPTRDIVAQVGHIERAFGDYRPGRWAWELADVQRLAEPVPFRGSQGFFEVPDEVIAAGMNGWVS